MTATPLVRGLRRVSVYDPGIYQRGEIFWPIRSAAARIESTTDFPSPLELSRIFATLPIRFEEQVPVPRRRRKEARTLDPLGYDGSIVAQGIVPTRARNWHDLFNALVWAVFPQAKAAIHQLQHEAIRGRQDPISGRLPGARTPIQDAVAMLDEGGVVLLREASRYWPVVIGHALFEGLALGTHPMIARVWTWNVEGMPDECDWAIAEASRAVLHWVAGPLLDEPFDRARVDETKLTWVSGGPHGYRDEVPFGGSHCEAR